MSFFFFFIEILYIIFFFYTEILYIICKVNVELQTLYFWVFKMCDVLALMTRLFKLNLIYKFLLTNVVLL